MQKRIEPNSLPFSLFCEKVANSREESCEKIEIAVRNSSVIPFIDDPFFSDMLIHAIRVTSSMIILSLNDIKLVVLFMVPHSPHFISVALKMNESEVILRLEELLGTSNISQVNASSVSIRQAILDCFLLKGKQFNVINLENR